MSAYSLNTAIHESLKFLQRLPDQTLFRFGPDVYTLTDLRESLVAFRKILAKGLTGEPLQHAIATTFFVYKSVGFDGHGTVLFTGYYEPVLRARASPSKDYAYPVYRRPDDWVVIDLSAFGPEFARKRIVGRLTGHRIVPYYTRRQIDTLGSLSNKGYELFWVSDPIALFFVHIQGSAKVIFEDGTIRHIGYDGSNGKPYTSIGKLLAEREKIPKKEVSLQNIQSYLREHPEERESVLHHNERYVFFRFVPGGPAGALDVALTAGRSIATDLDLFPRAALAFIQSSRPIINHNGVVARWKPFRRFVLNHDTGSAIRGPGRVDVFWGSGAQAEKAAGSMKQNGSLYFLIRKPKGNPSAP